MFKIPIPDNRNPAAKNRYYFGIALALGMMLSTMILALLEYSGLTNFLPNWP